MTTTKTPKVKKIHAVLGLDKMPDGKVTPLLDASLKGLTVNATIYANPPVPLAQYQTAISAYESGVAAAVDGGKTAIAQKNKLRDAAVKLYTQLAHYVEANCNEDMTTFLLSGFTAKPTTKAAPQPLAVPTLTSVLEGAVSGQLKVKIASVPGGLSYDLRYGAMPPGVTTPGTTPATWTDMVVTSTKAFTVSGLTPGTVYAFQVRALGRLGYTDWCDSITRMCI
jgi:hypothetical protein